jgi:hypothetical protein
MTLPRLFALSLNLVFLFFCGLSTSAQFKSDKPTGNSNRVKPIVLNGRSSTPPSVNKREKSIQKTVPKNKLNTAKQYTDVSDEEIINLLASRNPDEAQAAAKNIFARGEKMIPYLINLEGHNACFLGLDALGEWDSPGLTVPVPSCHGSSKITVEVAALFLVSAIFYDDIKFAAPPALCDFSSEKLICTSTGNTDERVKKAWDATKTWKYFVDAQSLEFLRKRDQAPLKDSGLSFF